MEIGEAIINIDNYLVKINALKPIDMSIGIHPNGITAYYQPFATIEAVKDDNFIGDISMGGVVNFKNVVFNPHAHCTHTECVGHIIQEWNKINDLRLPFFIPCYLLTLAIEDLLDEVKVKSSLDTIRNVNPNPKSLVLRTNYLSKLSTKADFTNTNPPFLSLFLVQGLINIGIEHLLVDLPSVDPEKDNGVLAAHHLWFDTENQTRFNCTITEFIKVPEDLIDGLYILNLQLAKISSDAVPSVPLMFEVLN